MKGIILAGGTGSRLWPATRGQSKQQLHVYDKPLVHYPLATLMQAGIRDFIIITTPEDENTFKGLLGNGSSLGLKIDYAVQSMPGGIAQAILICEPHIRDQEIALILGDNIFYGPDLSSQLNVNRFDFGATIFAYAVKDPERYGVVEFNQAGEVLSIEEKPQVPKSSFAVPGLYFYDKSVLSEAKKLKPSQRGELEISDLNRLYLEQKKLHAHVLTKGTVWFDAGTFSSLHDAGSYVRIIEERQGQKIGCLEEISWKHKWISDNQLKKLAAEYRGNQYGQYLENLLQNP